MSARFTLGWMQVAICFVFLACDSMITSAYSLVAVPLEQEFHTSRMVLMLANTVMALGSAILAPVLGAAPDEVVVCDTTSINLFKALAHPARIRILEILTSAERPVRMNMYGRRMSPSLVSRGCRECSKVKPPSAETRLATLRKTIGNAHPSFGPQMALRDVLTRHNALPGLQASGTIRSGRATTLHSNRS